MDHLTPIRCVSEQPGLSLSLKAVPEQNFQFEREGYLSPTATIIRQNAGV